MADTAETVAEEVEKKLAVTEENPAASQVRYIHPLLGSIVHLTSGGKEEKEEEQEKER
jgi:hypothetical protein